MPGKGKEMAVNSQKKTLEESGISVLKPARPMQILLDEQGESWICDLIVDPGEDFRSQGCIPCGELTFTRND